MPLQTQFPINLWGGSSSLYKDLVAYWKLDESSDGSGAVTRNDSVGSNHLTDVNTTPSVNAKIDNGANFQVANSEYFTIADNADISVGDISFTFDFWINLTSGSATRGVIWKGSGTGSSNQYQYGLQTTSTNGLTWIVSSGPSQEYAQSVDTLTVGSWTYVAVWHDSTRDEVGVQINNGTPVTEPWSNGSYDGTGDLHIGARAGGVNPLDAKLDEVGFWKRVLTPNERATRYNNGNGNTYPFSSGSHSGPVMTIGTTSYSSTID